MAITPADIEKKTFSTALRGYDLDEVDDFLDEMVVAVRELEEELARARGRIAELEQDPGAVAAAASTAPAVAPGVDESAVGRALVAAQQAADRMLDEARGEAEKIVGNARFEADTFVREREERKAAMEAEMADMTGLVAGVRTQLAVLATTVADKLDEMDAAVAVAQGHVAPSDHEMAGVDDGDESDVADLGGPGLQGPGAAARDEVDGSDAAGHEDGDEAGLELDLEEMDASDDEDRAGSSEIEGVGSQEEGEEI